MSQQTKRILTTNVLKFLYSCVKLDMKVKPKPLTRMMTDIEWELAMEQVEDIKLEQGLNH